MDFRQWAERTLRTAEGGESLVRQVQLTTEGQTWQTWDAPFILDSLVDEAATMIAQLVEESPVRRCTATFIATGADGSVRGSLPVSYMGKNKQAGELSMGATAQASKSFAESMETLVRVVNVVLKSAEVQVQSLTRTCESQATQLHEMHEYNRLRAELELVNAADNKPDASEALIGQVKENLPLVFEAIKVSLAEKAEKIAAEAVKRAANGAAPTTTNTPAAGAH